MCSFGYVIQKVDEETGYWNEYQRFEPTPKIEKKRFFGYKKIYSKEDEKACRVNAIKRAKDYFVSYPKETIRILRYRLGEIWGKEIWRNGTWMT